MSLYVTTIEAGETMAYPDVCKTPTPGGPVPMPYPNDGMTANAVGTTLKVLVCGVSAVTKASKILMTEGDEGGTLGGVVSGGFKQQTDFVTAASKVFFEGKPVVRLNDATKTNNGNASGRVATPSQFKVTAS